MRTIILTMLTAALAGCGPMGLQHAESTPFSGNRLANTLAGRGAGLPLTCLPTGPQWRSDSLQDGRIAYRSGRQLYVGTFAGRCSQLGRPGVVMVTKARQNGICRGDVAEFVDSSTGIPRGVCFFGPFIPYDLGRKFR